MTNTETNEGELSNLQLLDVKERWHQAPEVPLAHHDPNSIVTDDSLRNWISFFEEKIRIRNTERNSDPSFKFNDERLEWACQTIGAEIPSDFLMSRYQMLRFLSLDRMKQCLKFFQTDILKRFDPTNTLIVLKGFSSGMFYEYLKEGLENFGTVDGISITNKGQYSADEIQTETQLIFIDDFALSFNNMRSLVANFHHYINTSRSTKVGLHTYHMVVSNVAQQSFLESDINHLLHPHCAYRIDEDPEGISMPRKRHFSVYTGTKVPRNFPPIYANPSDLHTWSIFPIHNEQLVLPGTRLVEKI